MKAKIRLITTMAILLAAGTVQAVDVDFYSDAVIEEGDQYNNVRIFDTPPDQTTVSMFGGSASFIQSYDSSILNMFGGTTEACAYNQSTINVSGGTIYTLNSYDSSTVNTFGGFVYGLTAYDTSTAEVDGIASLGRLDALGSSILTVRAGTVAHISAAEFGTVNLLAGTISDKLWAGDSGIINVYGYNLAKTDTGGHYGYGFVSGEWIDHTAFSIDLSGSDTYQHINLITVIDAEIDIVPNTLNLASKGKWIMCYIRLGKDYDVGEIDPDTILLERKIKPTWAWFDEQDQVAKAKFKRSEVQEIIEPGERELAVTGHLADLTYFEGTDTIRVIEKGRLRGRRVNSNSKVVDGIEYYIQTDKAVYNLGEEVEMLYSVTNLRNEEWRFGYMPPVLDILVAAKERESFNAVWFWSWDKIWPMGPKVFRLEPGESVELNGIWPQIDLNGSVEPEDHTQAPPGRYRIGGRIGSSRFNDVINNFPVTVDITIIKRKS